MSVALFVYIRFEGIQRWGQCIGFSYFLAYVIYVDSSPLRARSCSVCLAHRCVALTSTEVEELNTSLDAFKFALGKKGQQVLKASISDNALL